MSDKTGAPDSCLEIGLLGGFSVSVNGGIVEEGRWARRSAKSLVKILALNRFHSLHREQVMDLLWAEEAPPTAINNLNKAIYDARRALEPDLTKGRQSKFILTEKQRITLDAPGALHIDLDEYEKLANFAIQTNDLEAGKRAVESYGGDLLIDDMYDDWTYARRESVRILHRKTATKTAELLASSGDRSTSIDILNKLTAEDGTDEYVHRLLMRFYVETGNKFQALKQYERCRESLRVFGIEPETETIKLAASIKRGEFESVQSKSPPQTASPAEAAATTHPRLTQLTFRHGRVRSARFAPSGESIVFSADWNEGTDRMFSMNLDSRDTQEVGMGNAIVHAAIGDDEMLVGLNPRFEGFQTTTDLARCFIPDQPLTTIQKDVFGVDCLPKQNSDIERTLAVVRESQGKRVLECPEGNVIYESTGFLGNPRIAPDGKRIAFFEYPLFADDRGFLVLVELGSKAPKSGRVLTELQSSAQGIAWRNDEIWFTSATEDNARILNAISMSGEARQVYRGTGRLTLCDISCDGKVLLSEDKLRVQTVRRLEGERSERNMSWHDWTLLRDLSDDGASLLFEEAGLSGGHKFAAYLRPADGSAAKKISDGSPIVFSPDGTTILLRDTESNSHLVLLSLVDGQVKRLDSQAKPPLSHDVFASFFPDGKKILFAASDSKRGRRVYVQEIDGGSPNLFGGDVELELTSSRAISPDGNWVVLRDTERKLVLYRAESEERVELDELEAGFSLIRWSDKGESFYIWNRGKLPAIVYEYDLKARTRKKMLELKPENSVGADQILGVRLTPDGKGYSYSYMNNLSDLFLMEGV
ncbi:MAG: BTAD domain-containing putative transcriptional regulator [Pyrinomonadaceae bacterium]